MVLVDTSVWIDHFRRTNTSLAQLLLRGMVCTHPDVIGELACGNLHRRAYVIEMLQTLPRIDRSADDEALFFLQSRQLFGTGLGYIDIHLLAAAALACIQLWSLDKSLRKAAQRLRLAFETD